MRWKFNVIRVCEVRVKISVQYHRRKLHKVSIPGGYFHSGLFKLNAFDKFLVDCWFDCLLMFHSLHKPVNKFIILLFSLDFHEFFIGQYTAFMHNFVLFLKIHQFLGLFYVSVLPVFNLVYSFHHTIVLALVMEFFLLFNFIVEKSFFRTHLIALCS